MQDEMPPIGVPIVILSYGSSARIAMLQIEPLGGGHTPLMTVDNYEIHPGNVDWWMPLPDGYSDGEFS
jgi:hypothetical protein